MVAVLVSLLLAGIAVADPSRPAFVDANPAICSDTRSPEQAASAATPFCTVGRALATVPGDTVVLLRAGSYPKIAVDGFTRPTYVTIKPAPGEAVAVAGMTLRNADHLRFEGLKVTASLEVLDAGHDLQFVGNDVGNQRSGMYFFGSVDPEREVRDVLIEGNVIHDIDYQGAQGRNDGYGISLVGITNHFVIRGNTIRSVAEDYIQGGGSHLTVEGNTFLGPGLRYKHPQAHADLWQIFGSSDHITFRNNVVRDTGTNTGLLFQFSAAADPHEDITIENNVFDNGSDGYELQIYNTRRLRIVNNTIVGSRWGTLLRDDTRVPDGSDYTIVNNIFDAREDYGFSAERDWGVEDHNLIARPNGTPSSAFGTRDIVGRKPRFVDEPGDDLRLAPASPGVDAASAAEAPPRDLAGNARVGPPDIGACESGAAWPCGKRG